MDFAGLVQECNLDACNIVVAYLQEAWPLLLLRLVSLVVIGFQFLQTFTAQRPT